MKGENERSETAEVYLPESFNTLQMESDDINVVIDYISHCTVTNSDNISSISRKIRMCRHLTFRWLCHYCTYDYRVRSQCW